MYRRRKLLGSIQMWMLLIIKENMRFQRFQNPTFIHAAEKMGFIDGDIPTAQGVDHPAVCRGTAGGDDGSFEKTLVTWITFFAFIFQCPQVTEFTPLSIACATSTTIEPSLSPLPTRSLSTALPDLRSSRTAFLPITRPPSSPSST